MRRHNVSGQDFQAAMTNSWLSENKMLVLSLLLIILFVI